MERVFDWLIRKIGIGALITLSLLMCITGMAAFGLPEDPPLPELPPVTNAMVDVLAFDIASF